LGKDVMRETLGYISTIVFLINAED